MKIKMLKLAAGPERTLYPGKTYDLPAKEAKAMINADAAVEADKKKSPKS